MATVLPHVPPALRSQLNHILRDCQATHAGQLHSFCTSPPSAVSVDHLEAQLNHIVILYRVACLQSDKDAALTQISALKLNKRKLHPIQELYLDVQLLYNDVDYAVTSVRRTYLMPTKNFGIYGSIANFWANAEPHIPLLIYDAVPESIAADTVITTALLRTRRSFEFAHQGVALKTYDEKDHGDLIYTWTATTATFNMGTLLNRYLDYLDKRDPGIGSQCTMSTLATVSLMLCYIIRKDILGCDVDGVDMRDAGTVILPRIAASLNQAMSTATRQEETRYHDVWLWICFWGAHYEARAVSGHVRHYKPGSIWFGNTIHKLTVKDDGGFIKWAAVKRVLESFVFMSWWKPNPEEWYERMMVRRTWGI